MNTRRHGGTTGAAVAGLGLILFVVSGCALVNDVAYGRAESSAPNGAELAAARGEALDWLPADAADIRRVQSTRSDAESLVFRSATGPVGCDEVDRTSAPTMTVTDAPDVYAVDRVRVCGDWAVATVDGVSYAWTPGDEAEPGR